MESLSIGNVAVAVGEDDMAGNLKILLAEDEPSMRRYIQMIMSRWDCELAIEPTAETAIQRAATFKTDVALLGLTPGMDRAQAGIGLLRISPGTQIVLFNESVPADMLSALTKGTRCTTFGRLPRRSMNRNCGTYAFHPITKRESGGQIGLLGLRP